MKTSFAVLICFYFISPCLSQGIIFKKNVSLQTVLSEARRSEKLVFVDTYTDWCSPCKQMDAEVFSKPAVGDFFNKNFINLKTNAEKGDGIRSAKRYHVTTYPTFLFLNKTGNIVYRFSGLASPKEIIEKAKLALKYKDDPTTVDILEQRYTKNPTTINLFSYLEKRALLGMESGSLLEKYFRNIAEKDILSSKNLDLLISQESLDIQANTFRTLWMKYDSTQDEVFKKKSFPVLEMTLRLSYHNAVKNNSLKELNHILSLNAKISTANPLYKPEWEYLELFYRKQRNYNKYVQLIIPELITQTNNAANLPRDDQNVLANTLNNAGEFLFQGFSDSINLNIAKALLLKGIEMKPDWFPTNFMIYHSYSNVLYKLGHKEEAQTMAIMALSLITEDDSRFNFRKRISEDLEKMKKGLPTW